MIWEIDPTHSQVSFAIGVLSQNGCLTLYIVEDHKNDPQLPSGK
jgi:hypothetical protein